MKRKKAKKTDQESTSSNTEEFLVLGHLIKYNLYLLVKSVVFSAVVSKCNSIDEAVDTTNSVISELDLDSKRRYDTQVTQ